MNTLEIIITILVPPVAVGLRYGIGGTFWLNLLLTLIGWLPGVIHGLVVMTRPYHA